MAIVLVLFGGRFVIPRTPTDIFPEINIPVIAQVWTYTGLQPQEMEQRITSERGAAGVMVLVERLSSTWNRNR